MTNHAKLGPSAAHRWMRCPGSVSLGEIATGGERTSSAAAAEGTVFHEVIEDCLRLELDPITYVGRKYQVDGFDIEVDVTMVRHVVGCLDSLAALPPAELYIEQRVKLDAWLPDQFGTLDIGLIGDGWIGIWDWKYGQGVPVTPEQNEQLMLYALGFWDTVARHKTDAKVFRLYIEQPRNSAGGGFWETTLDELLKFGERAAAAGIKALSDNPEYHASEEACRFCPARDICNEYQRYNLEQIGLIFEDLDAEEIPLEPVQEMTAARASNLVKHTSMIKKWLDGVYGRVLATALAGEETPGLKAVLGRPGNRRWEDVPAATAALEAALDDAAYKKTLISPSQAEKVLGTEQMKELRNLIGRAEAKPVIVDENDKREAVTPTHEIFDNLDE